jgi:YesN/AraC family two-component response regulator
MYIQGRIARCAQSSTEGDLLQSTPPPFLSALAGKRIVTVEDESITQMQLRKVLTRAGLVVVGQAMNGRDGVELILREKPDLVTMDITMPIMDGLEATRQIMEQDNTCVVIVSAYTNEEYRQKAAEVGACGYVVKPIAAASLLPALEYIYEHRAVK